MMTSHPNIVIPPEGDFLVRLGWKYDAKGISSGNLDAFIDDLFGMENIQDWEIQKESLEARLRKSSPLRYAEAAEEIYKEYNSVKFAGSKNRWGDKTTWYSNYIPQILDYYPDMMIVHLVRDARAVAASYKRVDHLSDDPIKSALDWLWINHVIERAKNRMESRAYYRIRYEDLVRDPEKELISLCEFLDEPFDDVMLDYWLLNRNNNLEPKRHLGWKGKTLEQVTTTQIDEWKSILSREEINAINELAGKALARYHYELPDMKMDPSREVYWNFRLSGYLFFRKWGRTLRAWKGRTL